MAANWDAQVQKVADTVNPQLTNAATRIIKIIMRADDAIAETAVKAGLAVASSIAKAHGTVIPVVVKDVAAATRKQGLPLPHGKLLSNVQASPAPADAAAAADASA